LMERPVQRRKAKSSNRFFVVDMIDAPLIILVGVFENT